MLVTYTHTFIYIYRYLRSYPCELKIFYRYDNNDMPTGLVADYNVRIHARVGRGSVRVLVIARE